MTGAPTTYDELRHVLQARLQDMAPGQARIARLLLDDPEGTAFRTIGETAALADVHSSSLVRFANLIDLAGYPAMVRLCRERLATEAQLIRRFEHAREQAVSSDLLAAVVEHDTRNLTRTVARVDDVEWDRVVELVAEAPSVHVIGLRKCYAVAYLAAYLLHLVRPQVHQMGRTSGLLVDDLRDMTAGDVLIALSIRRYTKDTVRALSRARAVGVHTVALTDDPSSPLVPYADLVFYVETGGVTVLRSLSAFTSMVQALATAVAVRLDTSTRDQLLVDEDLLDDFEVYAGED